MKTLHDDELGLLASIEGNSAFLLLLPILRSLALHIAGRGEFPKELAEIQDINSNVALEKARYRALRGDKK